MSAPSLRRILLVEDDADIQDAMSELLVEEGFEVLIAGNGAEAIHTLEAGIFVPQLILLDLMMPVMDGHTFRARQAQNPNFSAIPVIVLSADRNAKEKSIEMGVAGFLAKPVDLDELLGTMVALAGKKL